jgi:hypothetical protein
MKRNTPIVFIVLLVAAVLTACSGKPRTSAGGGGGGGGTGTATLTLTLIAEPLSLDHQFTVLAFPARITSLVLNQTVGAPVALSLSPITFPVDFNRLITDTADVGTFQVPAQTTFTSMSMALSNIEVTIANGPNTIGACAPNTVCQFNLAPSIANITASKFPTAFLAGTRNNLYMMVHTSSVLTSSTAGLAVDFSPVNFVPILPLPRAGAPANALDLIEDFTGQITAVSSSSISILTGTGVPLTAALSSSTTLDVSQASLCPEPQSLAGCLRTGQTVSMDAIVNLNGSLTATEIDLLDSPSVDAIEGTIFQLTPTTFGLVVTDKQALTLPALISANIGDVFAVTLASGSTFLVDTKTLTTATPPVPTTFFQSSTDILNGQTLRLHVMSASGTTAAHNQALTANSVQLRFTRFTAFGQPTSTNVVNIGNVFSFFPLPPIPQGQIFPGITNLDKLTSLSSLGTPGVSQVISIRALFLRTQPNFYATKIRDQ